MPCHPHPYPLPHQHQHQHLHPHRKPLHYRKKTTPAQQLLCPSLVKTLQGGRQARGWLQADAHPQLNRLHWVLGLVLQRHLRLHRPSRPQWCPPCHPPARPPARQPRRQRRHPLPGLPLPRRPQRQTLTPAQLRPASSRPGLRPRGLAMERRGLEPLAQRCPDRQGHWAECLRDQGLTCSWTCPLPVCNGTKWPCHPVVGCLPSFFRGSSVHGHVGQRPDI